MRGGQRQFIHPFNDQPGRALQQNACCASRRPHLAPHTSPRATSHPNAGNCRELLLKPIQLCFTSVQLLRAYPQSSLIHSDPSASSAPVRRGSPCDIASSRSHTLSRRHDRRSNCSQRRPGGRNQAVSSGQEELLWRGRWDFVQLRLEALITASMKVMQGDCFMLAAEDQRCCCTAVKAGPILQPSPIAIGAEAACVVQSSQRPPAQAYAA